MSLPRPKSQVAGAAASCLVLCSTAMGQGVATEASQWTVPINFNVAQLLRVGGQILQVGAGARYWADGPAGAPTGWGMRFNLTLLFPR